MAKQNRSLWLFFVISCLCIPFLMSGLRTQSQYEKTEKDKIKEVNPLDFPVTDFAATAPADAKERAKREAKSKKYNKWRTAVDPHLVTVSDIYHWDAAMPSLPVDRSDAVIVGEVTGADAHLSSDRTGIYSEFTIQIQQMLKNDSLTPLPDSGTVIAERTGGRVRFPSGQVTLVYVSDLGMPQVGKKYVFFLTHNFDYKVRLHEDYRILTAYELRAGCVVPLDSSGVVNFDAHRDKNEQGFLTELGSRLSNSFRPLRGLCFLLSIDPGVPLRSTPGFMLSPAARANLITAQIGLDIHLR